MRALGVIDLPTIQKKLNLHYTLALDLFGSEVSTNAANAFNAGIKGRYRETKIDDDHRLTDATYPVSQVVDGDDPHGRDAGADRHQHAAARRLHPRRRRRRRAAGTRSSRKQGVDFELRLPHEGFHRQIGVFRDVPVTPDGRIVAREEWQARRDDWLPTTDDADFIESLMVPEWEPGRYAGWIAPPKRRHRQQAGRLRIRQAAHGMRAGDMATMAFDQRNLPGIRAALGLLGHLAAALGGLGAAVLVSATVLAGTTANAAPDRDVHALFDAAERNGEVGRARKGRTVDVRAATEGEVVVTVIAGEGEETRSPPASSGDMVVRNRCPQTGNEEILVSAGKFAERYEGPTGPADSAGWTPYRPRGIEMAYFIVPKDFGSFRFMAPWGEEMAANPGDAIVRDLKDTADTYRIAAAAFDCTYEILVPAG